MIENKDEIIPNEFINYCLNEIYKLIDSWKGIKITKCSSKCALKVKSKSSTQNFKDYFVIAKNWWDQKKKAILGPIFWLNILKYIESYIESVCLTLLIIKLLCDLFYVPYVQIQSISI